jgi:glycosyltransferase involved in cell wall biosynthesis
VTDKKISVIIPIYNREKYLDKCITSVITQESVNTEIILVDDGSTDSSGAICDKYASEHSNIRVFHTENHGVSHARNIGLDNSTGDYIAFLDSDDSLKQGALSALQEALEKNNSDYVIGRIEFFSCDEEFKSTTNVPNYYLDHTLNKNEVLNMMSDADVRLVIYVTAKLYKSEIWKSLRFPENVLLSEDDYLIPIILEKINSVSVLDMIICRNIHSKDSLIRSKASINHLNSVESNLVVMDYCISLKNFDAALFRFGFGTRRLLELKQLLNTRDAKLRMSKLYKEYCQVTKQLAPHVSVRNKLRFAIFRISLNLYSFIQGLGK